MVQKQSVEVQTEQFMSLIPYQEQLTRLYLRIKSMQDQNQLLTSRLEYALFKNSILEESALVSQKQATANHEVKNQRIFHELIQLQEEIVKEHSDVQPQTSRISKVWSQDSIELSPSNDFTGDNQISFFNRNCNELEGLPFLRQKQNINSHGQRTIRDEAKVREMQKPAAKIAELERRVKVIEKQKKMMSLENKRIRKMNQEYAQRIRKLETINEGKSILIRNRQGHKHLPGSQFASQPML